jgi:hypothetical protein
MKLMSLKRDAPPPANMLVAATRIESVNQLLRRRRGDGTKDEMAWRWYNEIGEVHFGIASGAREVSRSILKAIRYVDPMTAVDADGAPMDLVMAVQSEHGGQAGLISAYYANRMVTGDGFFFAYPDKDDPTGERMWFDFTSTLEITAAEGQSAPVGGDGPKGGMIRRQRQPNGWSSATGDAAIEDYNLDDVILARVWRPHPQWSDVADSPLKALELVCEELSILTASLKAKITSRLATAGFLLFPASLANSFQSPSGPDPNPDKLAENPFVDWVLQMMTKAITDPSSTASSIPFVFVVPDQSIELVKWVREEAQTFEVDIKQRGELIARILHGLDLRPEQIEGFADSNHWSAWSSQDVHLKVDVAPEMDSLCWALTTCYLWPQLRAFAMMPTDDSPLDSRIKWTEDVIRSYRVAYDLRELTVRPNKADSFGQVADRGGLKLSSLRAAVGATEDDAPDEMEYMRAYGWHASDAYMATIGLESQKKIDWSKVSAKDGPGPDPVAPGQPSPSGPGSKQPGGPGDSRSNRPKSQQPQ